MKDAVLVPMNRHEMKGLRIVALLSVLAELAALAAYFLRPRASR